MTTCNGVFDDSSECAVCNHFHDPLMGHCNRLVKGATLIREVNGKPYTTIYWSKCSCRTSVRR